MPFRAEPPRQLSLYSQAIILFSGIYAIIGWAFFCFGMIFFWLFTYNSTIMNVFNAPKKWEAHRGIVIKVEATNSTENEEEIFKLYYKYTLAGNEYGGRSYLKDSDFEAGKEVPIEYNEKLPEQSRIIGGRTKLFGWWAIFASVFPAIGLILIYISFKNNQKSLNLIKNGVFTTGKMLSKEPTGGNVEINEIDYPIYKYEFEFELQGRKFTSTCQTHKTNQVEDEIQEFILYQPSNPDYSMVYDAIPNAPTFNNHGQMEDISFSKWYILIAPTLSFLIHLPLGWYMMFS